MKLIIHVQLYLIINSGDIWLCSFFLFVVTSGYLGCLINDFIFVHGIIKKIYFENTFNDLTTKILFNHHGHKKKRLSLMFHLFASFNIH